MANRRTFTAQRVRILPGPVVVGGVSEIGFDASYGDIIRSAPDGAVGTEDVDRAGMRVDCSLATSDVTKINAILAAVPTVNGLVWAVRESGAPTYSVMRLSNIAKAQWSGFDFEVAKNSDAVARLSGFLQPSAASLNYADLVETQLVNRTKVNLDTDINAFTYPLRFYRPNTAVFDDGLGTTLSPIHVERLSMSMSGIVIDDYGDDDVSKVVDLVGFNDLQVTLTHRDAAKIGTDGLLNDVSAELIRRGAGKLTVTLVGRGGGANKTLTINNVKWNAARPNYNGEYSTFTVTGLCGWRKDASTEYLLSGGSATTQLWHFS